jgi:hypothetical protein
MQVYHALAEEEVLLDDLQSQWMAKVVQGCAHARVGLTIRAAYGGRLSAPVLAHILSFVFEGCSTVHLFSCLTTQRVAAGLKLRLGAAAAEEQEEQEEQEREPRKKRAKTCPSATEGANICAAAGVDAGGGAGGAGDQERPRLALVSLSLAARLLGMLRSASSSQNGEKERAQKEILLLLRLSETRAGGEHNGCEWLHGVCGFFQGRFQFA